ncbi:MAG: DUF2087 domain-containing protein [Actinomycetales bacterium]|nr:DUF2087 domain-containing protein [Candidatus Phosphoribacter baldrii]
MPTSRRSCEPGWPRPGRPIQRPGPTCSCAVTPPGTIPGRTATRQLRLQRQPRRPRLPRWAVSAEPIRSRPTITSAAAERTPDEVFRDKTLRAFFDGERLRSIPAKRKARVVVLLELLRRFEPGRTYAEREVNDLLRASHDDVASLRRELVDYRYLERADGRYWVTNRDPVRDANETQEVPAGEADLLAAMRSPAPSQSGRQAPPR